MTRSRLALVAVLVASAGLAAAWGGLHTRVRLAYWDRIGARALTDRDREDLETCGATADWQTFVKVVAQDLEVSCGEPWLVETAAGRVGASRDRVEWLSLRAAEASGGRAFRASMILMASGHPSVTEPMVLLAHADLPSARVAALLIAAGTGAAWGDGLGPRGVALGQAAALAEGHLELEDALPALAWLSLVGEPVAEEAVARASSARLGVDAAWLTSIRSGGVPTRALWQVPEGWRSALLSRRYCPDRACAAVWVALLQLPEPTLEGDDTIEASKVAVGDAALDRLARLSGADDAASSAIAWALDRTGAWVTAAPDPAARLRSLVAEPASDTPTSFARTLWDGSGAPFGVASVVAAVGRVAGVPVSVRSTGAGVVWIRVGDSAPVARTQCGIDVAGPPSETEWPTAAIEAAALAELTLTAGTDAARMSAVVQRLDPLVGATLPAVPDTEVAASRDAQVGKEVGRAVARPLAPPSGAVPERTAFGASLRDRCTHPVTN